MKPLGNEQTPQLPPGAGVQAVSRHRMLWILAGFMFIVLVTGWLGFHARWHNPLNRYKAELRARGEKLNFAELAATETLGSGLARTQLLSAASSLGQHSFSPGALDLMVYVQPGKARVAWAQDSPPWIAGDRPGAVHTWDEFIEQIQEAGQTLTLIRHLLTNPPTYWSPPPFSSSGSIPNFVPMRLSAQWLSGEAISSLRQGRLEDALRDIEAIATCAAIGRDSHSLVSQMIRVAVAGLGLSVTWEALQAPGWTEPQLERLQRAWEPVDLIDAIETGFVAVRADGEETWARAHRLNGRQLRLSLTLGQTNITPASVFVDFVQFPVYRLTRIDDDELFYLRSIQDSLERIRAIKKGQPWVELEDGLSVGATKVGNLSRWSGGFRHWISIHAMPNFVRATRTAAQHETFRQLALTAIALKRFQLRHGYLPINLRELSPAFLRSPTYDPMSGGPLQYIVRDDGRFLLYSTGKDGRDDGGEPKFIVFRKFGMWEDADAVWPERGAPLFGGQP